MLQFYVSLDLWEQAGRFLPRKPVNAQDFLFSMWTLLHLDRIDEANRLGAMRHRLFLRADSDFEKSCIVEAMGSLLMKTRQLDLGEKTWRLGTELPPFAPNSWERLAQLHALRGLEVTEEAIEFIRRQGDVDENIGIPWEQTKSLQEAMCRYAKGFTHIVDSRGHPF
jgi:hypothetical protein